MNASAKTNKAIIEFYKIENNITCPLHTYTKWRELGYQVKKGEKSQHHIDMEGLHKKSSRYRKANRNHHYKNDYESCTLFHNIASGKN